MQNFKEYIIDQEISSIQFLNKKIYFGTYHYEDGLRCGSIYFLNNNYIEKLEQTSGTFHIFAYKDKIYSANVDNISILNEKSFKTDKMNTNICINLDVIAVSQEDGNVTLYTLELIKIVEINFCDHILWAVNLHKNFLFVGCDCGMFFVYDLEIKEISKKVKRSSGVTSIFIKNDKIYVGGYDENIFVYDLNSFEEKRKIFIGGGVYKIIGIKNGFGIGCMYEGIKIYDSDFELIQNYKTESIAYAIDYTNEKIAFASFYDKKLYTADLN